MSGLPPGSCAPVSPGALCGAGRTTPTTPSPAPPTRSRAWCKPWRLPSIDEGRHRAAGSSRGTLRQVLGAALGDLLHRHSGLVEVLNRDDLQPGRFVAHHLRAVGERGEEVLGAVLHRTNHLQIDPADGADTPVEADGAGTGDRVPIGQ